jgi:hypothetical protein
LQLVLTVVALAAGVTFLAPMVSLTLQSLPIYASSWIGVLMILIIGSEKAG